MIFPSLRRRLMLLRPVKANLYEIRSSFMKISAREKIIGKSERTRAVRTAGRMKILLDSSTERRSRRVAGTATACAVSITVTPESRNVVDVGGARIQAHLVLPNPRSTF